MNALNQKIKFSPLCHFSHHSLVSIQQNHLSVYVFGEIIGCWIISGCVILSYIIGKRELYGYEYDEYDEDNAGCL